MNEPNKGNLLTKQCAQQTYLLAIVTFRISIHKDGSFTFFLI